MSTRAATKNAAIALRGVVGLFAGLLLAAAADYLDSRLRSGREVERSLGLPVLGEIPAY